ncbi:MAG: FadR/GntR family transcriptional regulator [Janthinobacterium lividum]
MQSFEPVSATRLYRMISAQIIQRIGKGDFLPGCRLPSERELAEQLQVSRTSVREALIALEIEGYVEVRVGSGVYVCEARKPAVALPPAIAASPDIRAQGEQHGDVGAFELLLVHLLVEPDAAAMAAEHATEAQLAAIEAAGRAMENSVTPRLHNRLFHIAIGEATGNAAMASTVRHLWDIHDDSVVFHKLEQHTVTRRAWALAEQEHDTLINALLERDPAAAKRAMRAHFAETKRRLKADFRSGIN